MTGIIVAGAGAFGTALANVLASDDTDITLLAREPGHAAAMNRERENARRLGGIGLHSTVQPTSDLQALSHADTCLLALPAQQTAQFLAEHSAALRGKTHVLCAKGIDMRDARLQSELVKDGSPLAVLSGPGFADEIARGLPTALTIAAAQELAGDLQHRLSRPTFRLYRSDDVTGVQLGGALKNVVAIACGIAVGAGLGESARAALMTRGFAEMTRLATTLGAHRDTLAGLSGLGDLALTCGSPKSRNFAHGLAVGRGAATPKTTTEGIATASATRALAHTNNVDMPITNAVDDVLQGRMTVNAAMSTLLARPPKSER